MVTLSVFCAATSFWLPIIGLLNKGGYMRNQDVTINRAVVSSRSSKNGKNLNVAFVHISCFNFNMLRDLKLKRKLKESVVCYMMFYGV